MHKLYRLAIRTFPVVILALVLASGAAAVRAQPPSSVPVTDDQVNAIAEKMYCPVCENIPLDVCPTAACSVWRAEIRGFLEAGWTEQQIIDDFVRRFGDLVVGTPQDPVLRILSLVTPWLLIGGAIVAAVVFFNHWRRSTTPLPTPPSTPSPYRDLLEEDLAN